MWRTLETTAAIFAIALAKLRESCALAKRKQHCVCACQRACVSGSEIKNESCACDNQGQESDEAHCSGSTQEQTLLKGLWLDKEHRKVSLGFVESKKMNEHVKRLLERRQKRLLNCPILDVGGRIKA